ncbi:MAG: hypothetical protein B7Z55_07985 [Planctomycetales bacterium 12-60-4]|nr:MAG: hypothetical protein B7Z55_07985 [Planctomycetales bacterium 12-60-4]
MSGRLHSLVLGLMVAGLGFVPADLRAQNSNEPTTLEGTVTSIVTKGKSTTIKVTDAGGNEYDYPITPKLDLEILAKGDDGFLAEGVVVKIDATESNEHFFGTQFDVYPQFSGRVPVAKAVKAPPKPGQSQSLHFISGEIVKLEDIPDGKYDLLHLKGPGKQSLQVYVEPNHRVRVILTDPKSIKESQSVTVTGRAAGQRFLASKISINTGETLKGAEFLPTLDKK